MIELIWIAIAALGCWNVYVEVKVRAYREFAKHAAVDIKWIRATADAMQRIDDSIKAEIAKREALEEMIGKYIATPQPIMLNMEGIHQAMCEIQARQCDPDSIIRQAEGKDWEGGCGNH